MPSKRDERAIGKEKGGKDWFDPESIKEIFGQTGAENKEQLMEETKGVGFADPDEIAKHPDLAAAHYLDDPSTYVETE